MSDVALANFPSAAPGNYVRISRELEDHPIVGFGQPVHPADPTRGAYSRAEAWLFLVFKARWQTAEVNNRGKVITLERGELLGARAWLANVWNWTEKQVRGFLDRLEAEMMIDRKKGQSNGQTCGQSEGQKTAHFVNVISIRNYSIYQAAIEEFCASKGQSKTDERATLGANERANQGPHINKGNIYNITTLEDNNIGLAALKNAAQDDDVFWGDDGVVRAVNGSRVPLEKILEGAADLDEVLTEISPKLPDKPIGRELVIAVAAAVAEHVKALELLKQKRGTRLPREWKLPKSWGDWAMEHTGLPADWVRGQAEHFADYWHSKGRDAAKLDWEKTWKNWIRNTRKPTTSTLTKGASKSDLEKIRNLNFLDSV